MKRTERPQRGLFDASMRMPAGAPVQVERRAKAEPEERAPAVKVGLTPEAVRLLENFEVVAQAKGGSERLRTLILALAIRGKLAAPMNRLCADTKAYHEGSATFALPSTWVWRRVDEVGEVKLGRQRSPENHNGPHMRPYLRVANVHEARIDTSDVLEMNFSPDEAERFLLKPNDVLLNEGQSYELIGRPALYRDEVPGACFQNTLIRFRCYEGVLPEFALAVFRSYMRSGRFRREAQQTTNMAHLSAGRLAAIEFPLPPLAEQKRIVAKLDELMKLCDDLEARQAAQLETAARLNKAALDALTSADGPEELAASWRCVTENMKALVNAPDRIEDLRESVLWLAVRGRLTSGAAYACSRFMTEDADSLLSGYPASWTTTSLGKVAEVIDPNPTHRYPTYVDGKVPLFSTREFKGRDGWTVTGGGMPLVPHDVHAEQWHRCRFSPDDIIFARKGRLGLARHPPSVPEFVFSHTIFVIKPGTSVVPDFLLWYLRSTRIVEWLRREMNSNTGVPTLGKGITERLPVPTPPLVEQKRIVAKVDQLMALCDTLEGALSRAEDTAKRLADALVAELLA